MQLLGQVLEVRNKAFGERALECAEVYLYYGETLFEQAQVRGGRFGGAAAVATTVRQQCT